ncbi:hypothetical protein [Actinomadura rugatobispora]|uniref:Serine/threonine protein kinase n=1 Tax=Actinomadura rugatobispora TaxID=1994 RepID=A0ABW1A8D6_9ACTN|nr:hypothetical protein GCM10010200_063030 [Actinomadura rugatobispora]
MRRTGSPPALLAGLLALIVIGTVVLVRTVSSDPDETGRPAGAPPPTAPARTVLPSPSGGLPSLGPATTYAARVKDSRAVVALTVQNGAAIAYVCDGERLEAWLRGRIHPEGLIRLQGPEGLVTGSVQGDSVVGAASLDEDGLFAFRAGAVKAPAGLYRATSTVRGSRLAGGWIVLPGGDQVGVVTLGRATRPAPALKPAAGAVTVDGVRVPVAPADPAKP